MFGHRPGRVGRTNNANKSAPSLSLEFMSGRALDSRLVFTRASVAQYFDATGTLQQAANNVARIDYGASPGGVTNIILQSANLTIGPWSLRNGVTISGAQPDPFGGFTGALLTNPSTSTSIWDVSQTMGAGLAPGSLTYTASVYAKDAGNGWLHMQMWDFNASSGVEAWFNLAAGTLGTAQNVGTGASGSTSSITSVGGGWFRVVLTGIPTTSTSPQTALVLRLAKADLVNSPASPVVGQGTVLAAPMVQISSSVGAYVATAASAVNFGATALGLLLEDIATNNIRNPRAEGAVAPTTLPTSWGSIDGMPAAANGITVTIVGTGSERGVPYIDLQYTGTVAGSITLFIRFDGNTTIAAVNGQTWTGSLYYRLVAGSLSLTTFGVFVGERDGAGVNLAFTLTPVTSPTGATLTSQRVSGSRTNNNASTAFMLPALGVNIVNGDTFTFTIRIGGPQLELGQFATSIMLPTAGTPAAFTRATETCTMPVGTWFNASAGSFANEFILHGHKTDASGTGAQGSRLLAFGGADQGNDSISYGLGQTNDAAICSVIVGGVTQVNTASTYTVTRDVVTKGAGRYSATAVAYTLNGQALSTAVLAGTLPTITNLVFAGSIHFQRPGNMWLRRARYWPLFLSDTQMIVATT